MPTRSSVGYRQVPLSAGLACDYDWMYDGSSDYLTHQRNPLLVIGSTVSFHNHALPSGDGLDEGLLLDLCDSIRSSLGDRRILGPRWEEAMGLLTAVLKDEANGTPMIEFSTVQTARLDKLLSDIVNPGNRPLPTPTRFSDDVTVAERLQRLWRTRFLESYFTIDQNRYNTLPRTGRLHDVVMTDPQENSPGRWRAKAREALSELEGNLKFEPGHWWLNLACAQRDGIVGSVLETPTKGKYGVTALPLVTGWESVYLPGGTVKYVKEGHISDIHVSLLSQVGTQIRILRGHRLQSPLAPKAGIRYDGLYIIRQYGQRLNLRTGLHRVVLTLERVEDTFSVDELIQVPRPSQLDDWKLFETYEGEMIKQRKGQRGFLDWKMERAREKMDQEQYMRTLAFQTSLELAKIGQPSPVQSFLKTRRKRREPL
ncbi:PUA-like domain-containing protein [Dactylonectria macrodidyma]|uniref:PUA-like domain-containing protein n=1 Tax=Dactylonectria macrodidyma TaxID=307937 RepID=A0A9P9FNW9_9HYPO|nr:PUA-like domain-containing protein [Dactylonectria macrodidyma]